MEKISKKGISLIVLVITIIVVIIIAGAIILNITNGGVLDSAKKAKFMSDFRSVEEGVSLYSVNNLIIDPTKTQLPLEGKLSLEDKKTIADSNPTLKTKIEELNGGKLIDNTDLYWISEPQIGVQSLSKDKRDKGYIMDVTTGQIYDYVGDVFENKRWHTLDSGVDEATAIANKDSGDEVWNGWIKLTLYYPKDVTDKKWRLGSTGELRADPMLMWQTYTGPIMIPIYRTQDIWISYKVNGKEVVVPPAGKLLVDIVPDKTGSTKVSQVNVKINYDSEATTKEYKINDSGWLTYTGPFNVTENCIVEARANKTENIYNTDGTLKLSRNIVGSDMVYIGNIGVEEAKIPTNALPAPTIERLAPQNAGEKARVKITYPAGANKSIYTVNYGAEENYSSEISIKDFGTTITAYYYDINGKKSSVTEIYINDTTGGAAPEKPKPVNLPNPVIVPAPTITRLAAQSADEKAKVKIDYPANAVKKVYKVNYGVEQDYTSEISVKDWGTNIIAYYYDVDGNMSQIESITINDTSSGQTPEVPNPYTPLPPYEPGAPLPPTIVDTDTKLAAPTITRLAPQDSSEKARVNVVYPGVAIRKVYTVNSGAEIEYTGDIKINGWGTTITAYYYDAEGNKSKQAQILINEVSTPPTEPPVYKPESVAEAPTIDISPNTGIVNQVTVTVTPPVASEKIYLKLGKYAEYKEYTTQVTVNENMEVYAYYKAVTGETSITAKSIIDNIKQPNKPYLNIDASPYPWPGSKGAQDVTITLNYSDATKIEYSEDGIVYQLYTAPFKVTKNERVYARATNTYGVTESYLDITNIGGITPPIPIQTLGVSINANPDPDVTQGKVAKVTISIEYDANTTEKLYSIEKYGEVKAYTGPFDITSNCTIYAYAKGANALGEATKTIDNLSNGISGPIISTNPTSRTTGSRVMVNIKYDKYATVKKYSIDGGTLQDYTEDFEVTTNGTKIYAYSENGLGQKSEAYYTIQNIIPEPPMMILDKGSYYLVKLSYPIRAKDPQYMWKSDGAWKDYKDAGILLIKPQFKDQVIKNGTLVKIEDENGNIVTFTGDYYLIDVPVSELSESISMRWERIIPKTPLISVDPTTATKNVTASITYEDDLVKKQYRTLEPGGTLGDWIDYTGPIAINKKNTIIYAKGMDFSDAWSEEGTFKVTNIDEQSPAINVTADLTTLKQQIPITVNVTDDFAVAKVKWAPGIQGESYFKTEGTEIVNNSIVNITENGYYTFYAEDSVGNTGVYTLDIENIDKTAPGNPTIVASPTEWTNGNVIVNITYSDDAAQKEYSIDGITWYTYISAITVTTNNTTVYAKATDAVGNQSGQSTLTITNIDIVSPTVSFGTNGGTGASATTTVTVSDTGSGLNESTLQYVWDTQNTTTPSSGWTSFINGATITKTEYGTYYLWIKALDNVGNIVIEKSNVIIASEVLIPVSTIQTENKTFSGATTGFSYNDPVIPAGFVAVNTDDANWYNLSTDWDKGLVIKDSNENQFVWVPVDGTNVQYTRWCESGYSYVSTAEDILPIGFNTTNISTTYKGFYIARYESAFDYNGGNIRAASKKSTNTTMSGIAARDGAHTGSLWNFINYTDAKTYAENMDTSYGYDTTKVGTNLIAGAEWDTVMKWIQNSGKNVTTDSKAWGNYGGSTSPANVSGCGTLQISGFSEYWKAKNIYDLAGNAWEWTNETESYPYNGVARGARYTGSDPAAYRQSQMMLYCDHYTSFRMALYVL